LDALPYRAPKLAIDVMTPHYAQWTVQEPPGDWNSPVPIPFLVVEQGATFVFGVLPAGGASGDDLDRVVGWLTEALYWAGAGVTAGLLLGKLLGANGPRLLISQGGNLFRFASLMMPVAAAGMSSADS